MSFSDLTGWAEDVHGETLAVFQRSCVALARSGRWPAGGPDQSVCTKALSLGGSVSDGFAKAFFEREFQLVPVADGKSEIGLFTGYFEPRFAASPVRTRAHTIPLRSPPDGLVSLSGKSRPPGMDAEITHALKSGQRLSLLPDRLAIEAGALDAAAPPIAWLKSPVDAFFLHIQGSGRLLYPDGSIHRVSYAGKNGHPYTSIGRILVDRGVMTRDEVSMQSLRVWLEADLDRAIALMGENKSYIFFQTAKNSDPDLGPIGQQGIPLTSGRSLAVDLKYHRPGSLLWLETVVPGPGSQPPEIFSRLMVVQDTGSAIKGRIRGDIFFGSGGAAGDRAGRMQAKGRLVALVPRS